MRCKFKLNFLLASHKISKKPTKLIKILSLIKKRESFDKRHFFQQFCRRFCFLAVITALCKTLHQEKPRILKQNLHRFCAQTRLKFYFCHLQVLGLWRSRPQSWTVHFSSALECVLWWRRLWAARRSSSGTAGWFFWSAGPSTAPTVASRMRT